MSLSKNDVLETLKKNGINNLDDLANAAAKVKSNSKLEDASWIIHNNYVIEG